jgi:hypothetical protein
MNDRWNCDDEDVPRRTARSRALHHRQPGDVRSRLPWIALAWIIADPDAPSEIHKFLYRELNMTTGAAVRRPENIGNRLTGVIFSLCRTREGEGTWTARPPRSWH